MKNLVLLASLALLVTPPVLSASASLNRCSCPCEIKCGDVTCKCGPDPVEASEEKKKKKKKKRSCTCSKVSVEGLGVGLGLLIDGIQASTAPWLGFDPPLTADVSVEAPAANGIGSESFNLPFLQDPIHPLTFVIDPGFATGPYLQWAQAVDTSTWTFHASFLRDPATYRLLDGDPSHLTDSMQVAYHVRNEEGEWVELGGSDATLLWEMVVYLDGTIAQIPDDAFSATNDTGTRRASLYSAVDPMELLVLAGAYERAEAIVDSAIHTLSRDLRPDHAQTVPTLTAFRSMQQLLGGNPSLPARPSALNR